MNLVQWNIGGEGQNCQNLVFISTETNKIFYESSFLLPGRVFNSAYSATKIHFDHFFLLWKIVDNSERLSMKQDMTPNTERPTAIPRVPPTAPIISLKSQISTSFSTGLILRVKFSLSFFLLVGKTFSKKSSLICFVGKC